MLDDLHQSTAVARFIRGDVVTIFCISHASRPIIEGRAVVLGEAAKHPGLHWVRFHEEKEPRLRLIYGGDWQIDPDGVLELLVADWAAGRTLGHPITVQPCDELLPEMGGRHEG